ncbi:hypothetical protein ABT224_31025 [Streptomyces sp. NPDC001584]|uniref:hypothetical protein n=1 Tax=Streptomyces sp. NPDC001584 TaxID=3154521 RepID=UPI003330ED09
MLIHPDAAADREGWPWLQLGVTLGVGDGDPEAEADRLAVRLADRLAAADRQELAEVWGGSWHHSEDLA